MVEILVNLDTDLMLAINQGLSNAVFDWIMPYIRNPYTWSPLYLFIIIFSIKNYGKKGIVIILFLVLCFGLADFTSASLIKPLIKRVRPCNELSLKEDVIARIRCGAGYSFPSAHASNHFALAIFLLMVFRYTWKAITACAILWACLISFAQVYVGVHYPLDILGGAALGTFIGYAMSLLFFIWYPDQRNGENNTRLQHTTFI